MAFRPASVSLVTVAATALGLVALAAPQAQARATPDNYSTSTSFGFYAGSPDAFLGQVASNNNRCRAGRMVKVFRERGRRDQLVGRDRASSTGQWEIELNVPAAEYYALVPRKKFGPGGRNVCRRYKSSTLAFG